MTANLPLLLLALLLLWFPRPWLRYLVAPVRRFMRARSQRAASSQEPWDIKDASDPRVDFTTEFLKSRNYVDVVRAVGGAVLVVGGLRVESCLQLAAESPPALAKGLIVVKGVILLVALLIQTIRYQQNKFTFFPPIFFLAGLSVPLCEPYGALFAFVAVWAINPMFGNAQGFLTGYALLMVVFGQYFAGLGDKTAIMAGVLCFMPVLLSLLANRPLVIFARKRRH